MDRNKKTNISLLLKELNSYSRQGISLGRNKCPSRHPAYRRYATYDSGCIPYGMQGINESTFSTERYIPPECNATKRSAKY